MHASGSFPFPSTTQPREQRRTAPESIAGKRVLVAEDDPSTREAIVTALRQLGLDVTESENGGRLLVRLAEHLKNGRSPDELDLVITDVNMPVINGLEVFRGLRAAHWTTPVIIVTGMDTPEVREQAERLDAVLLLKPLDLDLLEAHVRDLLEQGAQTKTQTR